MLKPGSWIKVEDDENVGPTGPKQLGDIAQVVDKPCLRYRIIVAYLASMVVLPFYKLSVDQIAMADYWDRTVGRQWTSYADLAAYHKDFPLLQPSTWLKYTITDFVRWRRFRDDQKAMKTDICFEMSMVKRNSLSPRYINPDIGDWNQNQFDHQSSALIPTLSTILRGINEGTADIVLCKKRELTSILGLLSLHYIRNEWYNGGRNGDMAG